MLRHCWRLVKPLGTAIWNIHKIIIAHLAISLSESSREGKDDYISKDTHCSIFITLKN